MEESKKTSAETTQISGSRAATTTTVAPTPGIFGVNPALAGRKQSLKEKFVYPLTDHGNAQLFARLFNRKVMYAPEKNTFYVWRNGRYLSHERSGKVALYRNIKSFILQRYREAASDCQLFTLNREFVPNDEALEWAKKSSAHSRIRAMLEILKTMPSVEVPQDKLDVDPFLLGVANGVLNLATGELQENTPRLRVTRYARAAFDQHAKAPIFDNFIKEICKNRPDLISFLQEVLGYTLCGLTKEHAFFLLLGAGANGKSTLMDVFFHILGDYANGMPSHAFIDSDTRSIRSDLARLPGVRLATCAEINTGKALDESLVKRMTGGDVITARFIGREFFDFYLAAKFFFSVNTLPKIHGADNGIYRRLVVIPFDADFSDSMDKDLFDKLKVECDGILAWAVEGFKRWNERGHFQQPDCVVEACKAYRGEMDTVQSFLDEACTIEDGATTPLGALYSAYLLWAKSSSVEPAKLHLFGTLMAQKGFKKGKSGSRRWRGVSLKAPGTTPVSSVFSSPAVATTSHNPQ